MKHTLTFFTLVAALAANAAEDEFALGVRTTDPLSPQEQRAKFALPDGFEIQLVASEPDINKPMNMAFDATGRLWVTTSREYPFPAPPDRTGQDRLMIFEDFAPDGRARKVTEFADGLNIPIGVYPFRNDASHWKAVVWSIPNIWLMEDTDGDGKADKREVLYGPFDYSRDTHGNQSSFTRGYDGWLYATHGFNNHSKVAGRDGNMVDMQSGNTYRMRLDGSRIEHFTHGQVNPFGMYLDSLGNFYTADCHSAPIYQLLAGGYYPSFGKPHDGLGFAPVMLQHSHGSTAISGIVKYEDDLWPEEYRNRMFIGNVMTSAINQDEVSWIGSTPVAKEMDDFLKSKDPWFRPVNLQLGPDGALYIADFYNRIIGHYEVPLQHPGRDRERGRIWRVIYKEKPLRSVTLPHAADSLSEELRSPSLTRRMLAMNEIRDRFGNSTGSELIKSLERPQSSEVARTHAVWLLDQAGAIEDIGLGSLLASESERMRIHALRLITERGNLVRADLREQLVDVPSALLNLAVTALDDSDALVRRCAAEALGTSPSAGHVKPLLDALANTDTNDTHLVYVLRKAIRDQLNEDTIFSEIDTLNLNDGELEQITRLAIAVKSEQAGRFLIQHRDLYADDAGFSSDALQHAARYAPPKSLDQLAAAIRELPDSDVDFQLAVFNAIRAGMDRRGVALSQPLREWAGDLAVALLDSVAGSTDWVNEPVDEFSNPANPWAFQERVQSDTGRTARMLSSFPHGEGLTGRLVSKPFPAPERLSFFLAGHDGYPDKPIQHKNYVQLHDLETGDVIERASPPRNDVAQKFVWDLSANAGKRVRLEIVDGDTAGAYAWLAVGRIEPEIVNPPSIAPAKVAERQIAGTQLALKLGTGGRDKLISKLTQIRNSPTSDLQARANAVALTMPSESHIARIARDPQIPAMWRREYLKAQLMQNPEQAATETEKLFNSLSSRIQARMLTVGVASPNEAEYVVGAIESAKIPPTLLHKQMLRDKLLAVGNEETRRRIALIVASLPEPDGSIQDVLEQRYRGYDRSSSNAESGRQLFTQLCATCHQLNGQGSLVGPQLDGIGNRGAERLIEDILDPNRNVDSAFRSSTFVLKNGDVESGLFRREDGALLVIANAAGTEFTVNTSDVTERHESMNSLMPSNFGEALSQEQFNDLLAFLLEQK